MTKEIVFTNLAPPPGAYSQAIKHAGLLYLSGQTPEDPATGRPFRGSVSAQAELALCNVKAILEAGGSNLSRVLKVTIFLSDMAHKKAVDEVYRRYFPLDPPARVCVAAKELDDGLDLEIDLVAACD
jgi:2-iminobutanoate/2-iminopropanoate deaminase